MAILDRQIVDIADVRDVLAEFSAGAVPWRSDHRLHI
jgi:hypothetical protein